MFDRWKHRPMIAENRLTALAIITSHADRTQLERIFEKAGWNIVFDDGIEAAADKRHMPIPVIVLYDRDLPSVDWRQAVQQLASGQPRRGVILASSVVDDYLWEEVIQLGGYDVLSKPFREDEVIHAIEFAWAAITKSLPSAPRTR
jgi:FixJ family two-component response regulator